MTDDIVNIEIDGKAEKALKGEMIISVTDKIGTYVPRFCYHEKLSIAANCRMCLVEVENTPKPMPACATPVMEGMRIFTRSPAAIAAQKATMEFLLINHPLDCPICDQGGECELQDLALGYGRDISRYTERKRVVKDKDIGPLVSTDMTRCIHCTRCIRFGEEITGLQELGTTERGEDMKIGTYVEKSIDHEMSGNIIDLCPVGALNNKPYRYSARAWEMMQRPTISPHDCVGSNMNAHILRGKVKRIVPRENESINETWLSDRDRFSYEGIYSSERLLNPRLKTGKEWRDVSWDEGLERLTVELQKVSGTEVGIIASPASTLEEFHLLSNLADHLGSSNIDYRTRQKDFSDQENDPLFPWLGCKIEDIEAAGAILLVGSNLRKEAPMIAHRFRKAALAGAEVSIISAEKYEYYFDVCHHIDDSNLVEDLAGIAVAAADGGAVPDVISDICEGVEPTEVHKQISAVLNKTENALVISGLIASRHSAFSVIRALVASIGEMTGASFGGLSEGPNSAGGHLAGVIPHRQQAGVARSRQGWNAQDIINNSPEVTLLFGLEPIDVTCVDNVGKKLASHRFVCAMTPYSNESMEESCNLLLPIGTFAETSGTYVNCEGRWQSFGGIAKSIGAARPGWRVLRVLGNLLDAGGFEYVSSEEVLKEIRANITNITADNTYKGSKPLPKTTGATDGGLAIDVPIYQIDAVVRRATALQLTPEANRSRSNN